jgi:hypothetical protein
VPKTPSKPVPPASDSPKTTKIKLLPLKKVGVRDKPKKVDVRYKPVVNAFVPNQLTEKHLQETISALIYELDRQCNII